MRIAYVVHILVGILVVLAGYVALYATKGATLHRKAGMVFVFAMLTTAVLGMVISVVRDVAPAINVPAALLTSYLAITSLHTIRPVAAESRWLDIGALLVAMAVTLASFTFAMEAFANGGTRKGMPAFPFVMFGTAGLLASVGDVRMLRSGRLQGALRLARHLWRMCFALFIAAMSFFIGQAQVFPKPIRIRPLLALPVVLVLVTMFYWLWRIRVRRSFRGLVGSSAPIGDTT
jgi:uncharacterized membrane protein